MLSRDNLIAARKQVKANRGSPGIDGMSMSSEEFSSATRRHWPQILEAQPIHLRLRTIAGKDMFVPRIKECFMQRCP